ncbi:MAG: hypothetical protein F6K17_21655 [Okeania sp. SIO3C4]|nr:hypothetical protein [Okeania sp. SIO3B3]NER05012.1 hypothetical protein [Okeania sp. SIO3C4]
MALTNIKLRIAPSLDLVSVRKSCEYESQALSIKQLTDLIVGDRHPQQYYIMFG